MPSPRKRIGFLPSEEVHEIIEKLCTANEFSQSKVTGLLVEEALRSRGVLNGSFGSNTIDNGDLINFYFDQEKFSENNKSPLNMNDYEINKKVLSDDIKMMYEFIEFKYFKKVMNRNKNILNKQCHTINVFMRMLFNGIQILGKDKYFGKFLINFLKRDPKYIESLKIQRTKSSWRYEPQPALKKQQ